MRLRRPQLSPPSVPGVITFCVVALSAIFVFCELKPGLLFMNTLTAGGDMGAHVWAPWFLKHHLLPHGRVSGWAPDWYDGFPALTFYFPLPAIFIAALSYVMPYAVAFKLITVSGLVSLPVSAWGFGRLARLPFPVPACLAAATVPFLFDTGYTILGGNIASTLAGEYAFSVGLSLTFLFLGLVAGGLETNKRRGWAALLFGMVVLCHLITAIFALGGGLILVAMRVIGGGTVPEVLEGSREPQDLKSQLIANKEWLTPLVAIALVLVGFWVFTGGAATGYGFTGGVLLLATVVAFTFRMAPLPRFSHRTDKPSRWLTNPRLAALRWAVPVGIVGGLLSAFWALPFVLRSQYMNDMGWEKIGTGSAAGMKLYDQTITHYSDALFPGDLGGIVVAGLLGGAVTLTFRRRIGIFWVAIAAFSAAGFILLGQGRLWNACLLPLYYLSMYMLAGLLIAEIGWGCASAVEKLRNGEEWADGLRLAAPVITFIVALMIVVPKLPAPGWWPLAGSHPWHDPNTNGVSFIPSWAEWNYAGYNGKKSDGTYYKPAYPEYKSVLDMMAGIGRADGCGRVMWEYEPTLDRFGTPMALMLLPLHTGGCMASEEGLFFESSATVPYHFLNQALLSQQPSEAMRSLPYGTLSVSDGVTKLQMLGVKYYLAVSPQAEQQAALDPRLTLVGTVPAAADANGNQRTWNAYEIANADVVAPLTNYPAVITNPASVTTRRDGKSGEKLSAREAWLENSLDWYQDPNNYDVPLAASGPANWQRILNAQQPVTRVPVANPARVTWSSMGDDRISFHVDNPGSPVVVRASYFPNWKASGAKGPYRITPNLMVVIPTKHDVTLHYGRTGVDWLGIVCTIAGIFGLVWLRRGDRLIGELPEMPEEPEVRPHLVTVEGNAHGEAADVLELHVTDPEDEPS